MANKLGHRHRMVAFFFAEIQNTARAMADFGATTERGRSMARIYDATVFKGAGVFSKNIKYQMPHLVWQFPDIKDIYPASINVQLDKRLPIRKYDCTTLPIPWFDVDYSGRVLGWQVERFSFLEILRFEIISNKIPGVTNGQRCRLHIP